MPSLKKEYAIKAKDFIRAGEASLQIKGILKSIGYGGDIVRRVSICAYESEMNTVMHGNDGILKLIIEDQEVILETSDEGPGIEDIERAMREGYSTATHEQREMGFGAGMGLPNIKRNADRFEIRSAKGAGTHLKMGFRTDKRSESSPGK